MRNQLKKWFAVLMAMVLGMPGYGLSAKSIQTKAEDGSVIIHVENEERHVQTGETVSLLDGVSVEGSGEESYRAVVGDVQEQDSGLSLYEEGMEEFVIPQDAAGKTYRVLYKAQSSIDNEVWNDVEGSEKEALLIVEGSSESEEGTATEENKEETSEEESKEETEKEDEETVEQKMVTIQGEEERTILANEEYDFIKDSDLVVKGPKEEENSYRLKVKEVKSPENGSYQYHEGDESLTPKESDEGLVYEVTYVAETSKDKTTWKEVEDVQFIQKLTVAVFRAEEVRGPLATEAILCKGTDFQTFVRNWNTGSTIKVKNLIKADVPSDLISASLRYKYETISDPSSPVKIYMWHDMNAYGQYVDTVYFGTEVPGATIYTNPDASNMFSFPLEKIYDSANPSTPYFFNTSKTIYMTSMFSSCKGQSPYGIPFDCTNGNGISPFGLMNTSNATDLSGIFSVTENLDLTGIETWNVHKVTNISYMFAIMKSDKIPWGIGDWEFDNLLDVNRFFRSAEGTIEFNMEKWDLSHCDASEMFTDVGPNLTIDRLKIGSKHVDQNGKAFFPLSFPALAMYGLTDMVYNGTWENEATGQQYFQCWMNSYPEYREFAGNNASATEFNELNEAYVANPTGISGTYKRGKSYYIYYESDDKSNDDQNYHTRVLYYKKTDTTATLINNPYIWSHHYFQNWEEQFVSPHALKNAGDTVPLNRNYYFKAKWIVHERTITYDLDGGVNNPYNPTKFIAGERKDIYEPTKPGMVFAGWTWTSASKSMPDPWYIIDASHVIDNKRNLCPEKAFPDEDVVLKAHWVLPRTITIHGNGGKITDPVVTTDFSTVVPDVNGIEINGDGSSTYADFEFYLRGKCLVEVRVDYEGHVIAGLHDGYGNDVFNALLKPGSYNLWVPLPSGTNDFYAQWKLSAKHINMQFNPALSYPYDSEMRIGYVAPDGSNKTLYPGELWNLNEYTGGQWDETSPNVTISLKGHEAGTTNEYVIDNFKEIDLGSSNEIPRGFLFQSFTISSPGSSHTYPTGNLTSYTFTGGFDKDVTITLNWVRAWRVQYVNLDDTPITTMQTLTEADLPYTFRNTYPPHAPWRGFNVIPIGWTIKKYNEGSPDAEGVYTSTGNLPTLYRGTWDATQFDKVQSTLKLYPMYSVDVNNDGIPDLFQNKNTLTISKEIAGEYFNHQIQKIFTFDVYFKDVHGNPIKNWPVEDTNGQTYTTDSSGKVTINLRHQEFVSFMGMLPNMILRAVETDAQGLAPEYAISYNGSSFTSGSDTGNVTYQDNTPLTFTFRNTDNRTIVPAGIKDTNTRVYVLLIAVLIALAFSIRMLKVRRRA